MDHAGHHTHQHELTRLQHDFPAYRIWAEALGDHVRLAGDLGRALPPL